MESPSEFGAFKVTGNPFVEELRRSLNFEVEGVCCSILGDLYSVLSQSTRSRGSVFLAWSDSPIGVIGFPL